MKLELNEKTDLGTKGGKLLYAKLQIYIRFEKSSQTPSIILFLIKRHIVKNEDSARRLLLIITLIFFVISIYLITKSFGGPVFIDKIK